MEALPTTGLSRPANQLPTLEKQYKESWFYAFLRSIKLEFVAKLLKLERVEVLIVPVFERNIASQEPVSRYYVNPRGLIKGALVGVKGQYCVEKGDEAADSVQRCINLNKRLPEDVRDWVDIRKNSSANDLTDKELEVTCAALEKLVKKKNQQLEKWHTNEVETLQKLHQKKGTQDRGASYLPGLVEADGKTFKAYSGSPAAMAYPKAGESLKPFTDKMRPVLECLSYVHNKGFAHGCVSKECIVEDNSQIRLDGFGMSEQQQDATLLHDEAMMNRVKYFSDTIFNVPNPELLPPEAFTHEKGYERAGDMWALGVTLAHWIAPEESQKITNEHIVKTLQNTGKLEASSEAIVQYGKKLKDVCSNTLKRETRAGHRFMILELLPKLLEANPEKRYTAEQALNHRCFNEALDNPVAAR